MTEQELLLKAKQATEFCYVPYSKFKVGAALLMKNGDVILGANIENSSYGLSMCAERNALYHARLQGYQKHDIHSLAVIGDTKEPISPCGACRQVMSELMPSSTPVYLGSKTLTIKKTTTTELLPYAFDGSELPTK
jgi:cytidine deaminase